MARQQTVPSLEQLIACFAFATHRLAPYMTWVHKFRASFYIHVISWRNFNSLPIILVIHQVLSGLCSIAFINKWMHSFFGVCRGWLRNVNGFDIVTDKWWFHSQNIYISYSDTVYLKRIADACNKTHNSIKCKAMGGNHNMPHSYH